ncbi:hypothetical protein RclHR1_04950001 [Rhizophagus clarus]|uniref:F-box domain-containing protein n=1 Tax=Rhizophagus clarus TaxID=94130 RepID=A0A2Z6SDR7_9GLOM|nr:hypothetical protein RclHR1_04950001 [Rhizophagus clarus]GES86555.1 hypothetical protein GLOIN_2v1777651 [Rhizophagus clarus]
MSKLNDDIFYLIIKELNNIERSLHPYLLVNRTWSVIVISTLWKNPWKYANAYYKRKLLLQVIISHLSDEKRNELNNSRSNFLINLYERPLFNYINFCKHLNLVAIKDTILTIGILTCEVDFFMDEIIYLFVNNENTNIKHLYIPNEFHCQIYLIPGAKRCFSEIEFLSCNTNISDNVLAELTDMCQSIRNLELFVHTNSNYRIVRLIESSKKLISVSLNSYNRLDVHDKSFYRIVEKSLIKHASTIQYFKMSRQPTTLFLSYLINLKSLELTSERYNNEWNCLENLSLPFLQILRVSKIPSKFIAGLIKNTGGYLTEFAIHSKGNDNSIIIQTICKMCPNLKFLKLPIGYENISHLENLLINCQYLKGLYILKTDSTNWKILFEILTRSSPIGLFKFKFCFSYTKIEIEFLKSFFNNWKYRHPMLLQFIQINQFDLEYENLMRRYKAKGIVKNFTCNLYNKSDFEWN